VAAFGAFTFGAEEEPVPGTDSGWQVEPKMRQAPNLGSIRDSILVTARGSLKRTFNVYLTPARLTVLQGYMNTVANFTDWFATPVVQSAFLVSAIIQDASFPGLGGTGERVLTRITLVSQ
jgi:hypothetical protein